MRAVLNIDENASHCPHQGSEMDAPWRGRRMMGVGTEWMIDSDEEDSPHEVGTREGICYPASRYPHSSLRHWTERPACLLTFSIRKGALHVGHGLLTGRSQSANSHSGYRLQE